MKTAVSSVSASSKSGSNNSGELHRHLGEYQARQQGFPSPTVGQLEEALEERVLPDRRVSKASRSPVVERRLRQRRNSDRA